MNKIVYSGSLEYQSGLSSLLLNSFGCKKYAVIKLYKNQEVTSYKILRTTDGREFLHEQQGQASS